VTAIYFDASALVKLVVEERESDALRQWLRARPNAAWYSSALVEVELLRAVERTRPAALSHAQEVLNLVVRLEIDEVIRRAAARLQPSQLRSLDAIHLATALVLRDEIAAFLVYDVRLSAAGDQLGLPVEGPTSDERPDSSS
jgi:hypothetical protein